MNGERKFMSSNPRPDLPTKAPEIGENLYVVVCSSGFDDVLRVRSALMFAALAAAADYHSVLYCVQNAVDVMVKGAIEKHEPPGEGPSIASRLAEALEHGVEIQCCTQTMDNKGISGDDLIPGAATAGAMSLISLTARAKAVLSF